ncbi:MAG: helix-turn-helix domain-containing protein [Planctomycetes bacterium]|nr:helix-turn-helix domain-containing protein [Planctomycetota bacterium]
MPRRTKTKPAPVPQSEPASAGVNGPFGEVLTLAEAAAFLRFPEADVLRLVDEQGLPARRLANEWRFLKAGIQHWLSIGSPKPRSSKEALLALAGKYKDDPDLESILQEAMRRRGRPMAEEE